MNNQIKEKIKAYYIGNDIDEVLDYITNLQLTTSSKNTKETADDMLYELNEENERLNNGFCELKVKCNKGEIDCTHEEYEGMIQANMKCASLLEDYKSRIQKANEFIKNTPLYEITYDYNMEDELEIQNVSDETASNKLLNILNGRSDE